MCRYFLLYILDKGFIETFCIFSCSSQSSHEICTIKQILFCYNIYQEVNLYNEVMR